MSDLLITNGDVAAELLAAAGRQVAIVAWRDVLHEGPIAFDLAACTELRVEYLARRFGIPTEEVAAEFAARNAIVRDHAVFDRIELWFEHDLYDQLQLIQILAFLADTGRSDGIVLVQADDFLGAERAETILRFAANEREITGDDLDQAERLWADLAMPSPGPAFGHLTLPYAPLPFVAPALERFFAELPAPGSGLSRTETTILSGIAGGAAQADGLFRHVIASEDAAFIGDESFFRILDDLAFCEVPLIAGLEPPDGPDPEGGRRRRATLALTEAGASVLAGSADHVLLNGLDRWWAGTRLAGRSVWRYDSGAEQLIPPD